IDRVYISRKLLFAGMLLRVSGLWTKGETVKSRVHGVIPLINSVKDFEMAIAYWNLIFTGRFKFLVLDKSIEFINSLNDDLLKKEATTDSRSETFSSIMKKCSANGTGCGVCHSRDLLFRFSEDVVTCPNCSSHFHWL
uniref:Rubicon Homology domain-containing protein n=1 Tax=Amphimedon queenslandica TaxID=400682 RepID=A0A1X7TJF9_AMPQE